MHAEEPNAPRTLNRAEVRALREHVARQLLDSTPPEEWDRYVLDTEPETAAVLKSYRAEHA